MPLAVMAAFLLLAGFPAHAEEPIKIGLTNAVFVDEVLVHDRWVQYLEKRLGKTVKFIQRKNYNDIQQMVKWGEVDFAWICGYPYVRGKEEKYLKYVATPIIRGSPRYKIYLIVSASNRATSLEELKGKIFAFSDPDSVSFRALVGGYVKGGKPIRNLDSFFKIHLFTYNHIDTVQAVADGLADGGSVDSHVWEALAVSNPELTGRTRVVAQSDEYGLPPFVASLRTPDSLVAQMKKVLLGMEEDAEGLAILKYLQVSRFSALNDSLYDSIRYGPALDTSDTSPVELTSSKP